MEALVERGLNTHFDLQRFKPDWFGGGLWLLRARQSQPAARKSRPLSTNPQNRNRLGGFHPGTKQKSNYMNNIAMENSHSSVSPGLERDNGQIQPGQVCLANESRFNSAFFSEPLTAYATGWRDPNQLEAILDFIAPPVQVGRRFEFKKADNSEAFLLDTDDLRAIGADFKKVEFKGATQSDKTVNKGLTVRVDLDLVGEMPNWRELYTARLLHRLLRSEFKRAMDLVLGSATNTAKTWDSTAGKDPDQDILSELMSAVDSSGVRPNRILFGDVAWHKRMLAHRAQATAGGYASAGLTAGELAGFLGVESVRVSRERYQSTASTKGKIVPDIVLLFYGIEGATTEDPTHAKRFWSAVEGGGKYRVYEQQTSSKIVDLTVEHYSSVLLTSTVGLRKLTIT
jgi:hypothetical protein